MKLIRKNKKGFTLVELIVVIAILAILALILIPALTNYIKRANDERDRSNARSLYSQAVLLYSEGKTETEITNALLAENPSITAADLTVTLTGNVLTVKYGEYTFPVPATP